MRISPSCCMHSIMLCNSSTPGLNSGGTSRPATCNGRAQALQIQTSTGTRFTILEAHAMATAGVVGDTRGSLSRELPSLKGLVKFFFRLALE